MNDTKSDPESANPRLEAWVRTTDIPLLVLALASVPLLVVEARAGGTVAAAARQLNWVIWASFAIDLCVRLFLVRDHRLRYLVRHWFDVAIVALSIAPLFQPLRIFRSARVLRLMRIGLVTGFLGRFWNGANNVWTGMHGRLIGIAVLVVVTTGSVAIWIVERDQGGPIENFGDGLWWALTTVTTVGYGDTYPITPEGRGIGAFLMFAGIAVFGVVSANLAALIIRTDPDGSAARESELGRQLQEVTAKLDLLLQDRR